MQRLTGGVGIRRRLEQHACIKAGLSTNRKIPNKPPCAWNGLEPGLVGHKSCRILLNDNSNCSLDETGHGCRLQRTARISESRDTDLRQVDIRRTSNGVPEKNACSVV